MDDLSVMYGLSHMGQPNPDSRRPSRASNWLESPLFKGLSSRAVARNPSLTDCHPVADDIRQIKGFYRPRGREASGPPSNYTF
jgi:hypothetical protein